jgi:hypothetical protein
MGRETGAFSSRSLLVCGLTTALRICLLGLAPSLGEAHLVD